MDEGMKLYQSVKPDMEYVESVMAFDVRKLDSLDGAVVSKYATALSQYLIYFRSEINKSKVNIHQKQRVLDSEVNKILIENKDILKKCKTKASAVDYVITMSDTLKIISRTINNTKDELVLVEGIDKTISDLVATLKRELTRRENELYTVRKERYS